MFDLPITVVTDEAYWTKYYESGAAPEEPSLFAQYVMKNHASSSDTMIELGCGNGRDARYFASNGIGVIAIDQCASEIEGLIETNGKHENLKYLAADFTDLPESNRKFDLVYSRFTLHSVSSEGQHKTLKWCLRNLAEGGKLCIEVRGQKNELFKKGAPVEGEPDAFIYNDHYRRFINFEDLKNELTQSRFTILESAEKTGFAPYEGTDYHFIRVIARK